MTQAARRLQCLHHLLERQVLMRMRRQHDRLDLLQQRRHAQAPFRSDAQRQCVDEEADQRLQFAARTICHRCADHHVILPAEPAQQTRPPRQQCHEQRRTMTLTQLSQPCR
ncbi:hypothetical protein ALO86_200189 [Pseudomonas syringae pv. berberidis]|nr:hypothetical protein ALO86_200189 [Pseudomonas syringae pv. berberidis]